MLDWHTCQICYPLEIKLLLLLLLLLLEMCAKLCFMTKSVIKQLSETGFRFVDKRNFVTTFLKSLQV